MADREKVINGLREMSCRATWKDIDRIRHKFQPIINDAIALLKEQEPKTGEWQWKIHGKPESGGTLGEAVCDQCGKSTYATAVKGDLNYCPNCGAKMTEGR